ncbi:uncharacterized protein LOC111363813 [Spodoptera litura]|uniref:Uncharacterized protein LOC111363813 n=1 Tax=Spodoptera litura TaxID=69820 RepID=A0A9J7EVQ0_SPOLT|nr:uncharacterized protein LOC111363813 [Spodoptera litura]
MTNQLPPPEKLDIEGDSSSVGLRWEKWKRSLRIYLEAADITTPVKKRATLLVLGGGALQEIFYNLPGANVGPEHDADLFEVAIDKLNDYFLPKQNKSFERHIFRLIKQDEGESFEKFLIKLRDQAAKCKFEKPDDHIIDQILEKCLSMELRKKMLTMGDGITLDQVITVANTLEIVNFQLDSYEQKEKTKNEVNAVRSRSRDNFGSTKEGKEYNQEKRTSKCTRCGNFAHVSQCLPCPAKDKKCNGCGKLGHYQRCCRTKSFQQKRKFTQNQEKDKYFNKRPRKDTTVNSLQNDETQYVFNINDDPTIKCQIGGVNLEMLIDSGCKLNIISSKTWEHLKENGVHCSKQTKKPNKILLAYGSTTPLQIRGSFEAEIKTHGKIERATIYVIEGGSRNLLGKDTALRLGVLKLGSDVNHVEQKTNKPFPKFKDTLIEIPIDSLVKSVIQPYRRIPIPLEEKINNKLKELLDLDIIEEVHEPSSWVSPIVPIIKDNGDVRLCVDMRRANTAILRENHPLPCMENLLPKIKKA